MPVVANRLAALGLVLPPAPAPVASYVPYVRTGHMLTISGQIPIQEGKPAFVGKLGQHISVEQGQAAARLVALALLAQAHAALDGNLDRIRQVVKLNGFVNCTPTFTHLSQVINGASELLVAVLGPAGAHARAAVGVQSLPLGVAVEIDAVVEVA